MARCTHRPPWGCIPVRHRTSTTRPHRRLRRWVGTGLATVTLAIGLGVATGFVTVTPAHADGFLGICETDTSQPPINPTDISDAGAASVAYTATAVDAGAGHQFTKVVPNDQATTPAAAYGGAGLQWTSWGDNCLSVTSRTMGSISNMLFVVLDAFPAKILGLVLLVTMGSWASDLVIGEVHNVAQGLYDHIFLVWVPIVIGVLLLRAIWQQVRSQRNAFSSIAWMALVVAMTGLLLTPDGTRLIQTVNDTTSQVSSCAVFEMTAGCDTTDTSTVDQFASSMSETLNGSSWAGGQLGNLADNPFPTDSLQIIGDGDKFGKVGTSQAVPFPSGAVPAMGTPTWADAWRWSTTYTAAEAHAMADHPELACTGDISVVSTQDLAGAEDGKWGASGNYAPSTELCYYKMKVHAALLSMIKAGHPAEWPVATGHMAPQTLTAALLGVGGAPLVAGFMGFGALALIYSLEMLFFIMLAPLFALGAMNDPQVAKDWAGLVVTAIVKRIGIGFSLGIALWFYNTVVGKMAQNATLMAVMAPGFVPVAASIVATLGVIVAYVTLRKLIKVLERHAGTKPDRVGNAIHNGAKKTAKATGKLALVAATGGIGGAIGAGMAGTSLAQGAAKGAAHGLVRSSGRTGMLGNGLRGLHAGATDGSIMDAIGSGGMVPRSSRSGQSGPGAGPRRGDSAGAQAAWDAVGRSAEVAAERARRQAEAAERLNVAEQARTHTAQMLVAAQQRLDAWEQQVARARAAGQEVPPEQVAVQRVALNRNLGSQYAAMKRADADLDRARDGVRAAAADPTDLQRTIDAALRRGQAAASVGAELRLSPDTIRAMEQYQAAIRVDPTHGPTGGAR